MKLNPPVACVVGAVLPKLSPGVLDGACEVWKGLFTGAACAVDWPKVKPPVAGGACALWPKENGVLVGWFDEAPKEKPLLGAWGWGVELKGFDGAAALCPNIPPPACGAGLAAPDPNPVIWNGLLRLAASSLSDALPPMADGVDDGGKDTEPPKFAWRGAAKLNELFALGAPPPNMPPALWAPKFDVGIGAKRGAWFPSSPPWFEVGFVLLVGALIFLAAICAAFSWRGVSDMMPVCYVYVSGRKKRSGRDKRVSIVSFETAREIRLTSKWDWSASKVVLLPTLQV